MEVTFLICNHNYGEWISDAIQSVLDQTVPCNLCIIDDFSTDDSRIKIKQKIRFEDDNYEMSYDEHMTGHYTERSGKQIILLEKENNTGPSDSRNIGIEACLEFTDIFAILDADDWVLPTKTEKLLPYFEDENIGVVYADYRTIDVDSGNECNVYKEIFDYNRLLKECIVHSGSFIRKQTLLDIKDQDGFYDKHLRCAEDYDLWLRISQKYMIIHHPEILTNVRVSQKNSTNSVKKEIWQHCMNRVYSKLYGTQN